MTDNKRYTWNSEDVVINDNVTGKQLEVVDITEIDVLLDLLNEQDTRIKELETEVLGLRAEVGRLNCKKEIETPHWLKYETSQGYTRQVNQDIRFKGDVDD